MKTRDSTDTADQRQERSCVAWLNEKATQDYFDIVNLTNLSGKSASHLFHITEVPIMTILHIMKKNQLYLNRAKRTFFLRFTSDSLDFFDWPQTLALNDNLGAADAKIKTIKKQEKFRLNF